MGRRERPLDPTAGPVEAFAEGLRELRHAAGCPSYRALARRAGYSASVLSTAARGNILPSLPVLLAYVGACGGDLDTWEQRWQELEAKLAVEREDGDAPAADGVPAQLPPEACAFAGRRREIAELDRLLTEAGDAVTVAVIAGTAGVGKTALAVHWAHRVADRFPDGNLYVDLRGTDRGQTLSPEQVLGGFLRTLGLAAGDVPYVLTERAARFRTMLSGRRMLIVLDNAASADQVRPLLPGRSSSFVVVTSRDSLAGLVARQGARRIGLDRRPTRAPAASAEPAPAEPAPAEPASAVSAAPAEFAVSAASAEPVASAVLALAASPGT
jgi:transcriptional regulator with XRE-family HTH domain